MVWDEAIERSDANHQLLSDRPPDKPARAQRSDPWSVQDSPWSSESFSLRSGISQSRFDALHDQRPFELRYSAEDSENHVSHRRRGVHAFGEAHELNADL